MRWAPRSLQGRLLLGLLGAMVAVWLATAAATWVDVQHELDELLDGHLAQAAAQLLAQQAGTADEDDDADPAVDTLQLHRYAPRVAFQVWQAGRLTMRSANAPAAPMVALVRAAARRDGKHGDDHDGDETERLEHGLRLVFHRVSLAGTAWRVFAARGAERDLQVFVGEQVAAREHILLAVLRGTLWPMALALPLLALAIWWLVRRGTAPLRALGGQLAARHPQALAPVQVADAPAEMAPMLTALNQLLARIAEMVAAERRFTADAAHELRTPIAAIRAQAQVALAEHDDGERAHALRATLAGCDRAVRLVEQLLTLSRLEADAPRADAPALPTDLGAAAQRVAATLAPAALQRGQTLSLDAAPGCLVTADEALLSVLLRNLVDNALRYSPDGATVQLRTTAGPDGVQLQVDDSGPGLAEADRRRLGERFFRVLGSGQDGSGLGWSIVRRIAAAQAAGVEVARSATLGGLSVVVRWPPAGRR